MNMVKLTLKDGTRTGVLTMAQAEKYYRDMVNYVVAFQLLPG